jgi:hypothetical protein
MTDWLFFAVLLGGCIVGATGIPRSWSRTRNDPLYTTPPLWPWGDKTWLAFCKLPVVAEAGMVCLAVAALGATGVLSSAVTAAAGVVLLGVLVPIILMITLVGRPLCLVPPALRDVNGLLVRRRAPQ